MTKESGWTAIGIACAALCGLIDGIDAQEAEHPAFGSRHISTLIVETEVDDIPKLEAKAVDVLRTKHGLTLEEARSRVRIGGRTDVARCIEVVTINAVQSVAQYRAVNVTVGNQHPEGQ